MIILRLLLDGNRLEPILSWSFRNLFCFKNKYSTPNRDKTDVSIKNQHSSNYFLNMFVVLLTFWQRWFANQEFHDKSPLSWLSFQGMAYFPLKDLCAVPSAKLHATMSPTKPNVSTHLWLVPIAYDTQRVSRISRNLPKGGCPLVCN